MWNYEPWRSKSGKDLPLGYEHEFEPFFINNWISTRQAGTSRHVARWRHHGRGQSRTGKDC